MSWTLSRDCIPAKSVKEVKPEVIRDENGLRTIHGSAKDHDAGDVADQQRAALEAASVLAAHLGGHAKAEWVSVTASGDRENITVTVSTEKAPAESERDQEHVAAAVGG